jgi:hypothetical protein
MKPGREFGEEGMPFLGYWDSVKIVIWLMVHIHGISNPGLIQKHQG